jgi:hypothetical protein
VLHLMISYVYIDSGLINALSSDVDTLMDIFQRDTSSPLICDMVRKAVYTVCITDPS